MFDNDDFHEEMQEFDKRLSKLPVMRLAEEILQLTLALNAAIDKEKDVLKLHRVMLENAYLLAPKIAGAMAVNVFSLQMENAILIKLAARELLAQTSVCIAEELADKNYIQLLRSEILLFQQEFVKWVGTLDRANDYDDGWGIKFL